MEDLALYFLWGGLVTAGVSSAVYILYASQPWWSVLFVPALKVAADTGSGSIAETRPRRPATMAGLATFSAWTTVVFAGLGLATLKLR